MTVPELAERVYLGLVAGVPAGLTALVLSAGPLVIAVAGVPLFGERLRPAQWLGLLLGLAGVALAVSSELPSALPVVGVLFTVLGLAGFSAGTLWQKRTGATMDLRSGSAVQLLGAAVAAAPLAAAHGGLLVTPTATTVWSVLWLAVINSLGGFTLLFVLLRRGAGGSATSYLFLVPPLTALLAVPVLGEPLAVGALGGIALAAVGVALVTWRAASWGPEALSRRCRRGRRSGPGTPRGAGRRTCAPPAGPGPAACTRRG